MNTQPKGEIQGLRRFFHLVPLAVGALILSIFVSTLFRHSQGLPSPIEFEQIDIGELANMLAFLLFISLFLERSMEVFVVAFRNPRVEELEREIAAYEKEKKPTEAREATDKLAEYKSNTRWGVSWVSLLIGVLISLTGVRVLEPLVEAGVELSGWQSYWFRTIDILLVGTAIAGGSKGIHKILNPFFTFLDTTNQLIKSKSVDQ